MANHPTALSIQPIMHTANMPNSLRRLSLSLSLSLMWHTLFPASLWSHSSSRSSWWIIADLYLSIFTRPFRLGPLSLLPGPAICLYTTVPMVQILHRRLICIRQIHTFSFFPAATHAFYLLNVIYEQQSLFWTSTQLQCKFSQIFSNRKPFSHFGINEKSTNAFNKLNHTKTSKPSNVTGSLNFKEDLG